MDMTKEYTMEKINKIYEQSNYKREREREDRI